MDHAFEFTQHSVPTYEIINDRWQNERKLKVKFIFYIPLDLLILSKERKLIHEYKLQTEAFVLKSK